MQSTSGKTRHSVAMFGEQIHIGFFRSAPAQARVPGDIASTANRLLSGVDGLSFEAGSSQAAAGNERSFEICLPFGGLKSRFQWRFFGVLFMDNSSVVVRGAFQLPRFLQIYFVVWLVATGVFTASGIAIAATSKLTEMWLLPLGALVVMAGGYATLFIARALAEPIMQRAASQLDRCVAQDRGNV